MQTKIIMTALLLGLSVVSCAHKSAPSPAAAASAMTSEKMMSAMEAQGNVGLDHALLRNFVGTWKTEMKLVMEPGKPAQVSKGTSVNSLILGGRFLEQKYSGMFMGKKMQGIGFLGYDNSGKKYNSYWLDSTNTAVMHSAGTFDENSKSLTFDSTMYCPAIEADKTMKEVIQLKDEKHYSFTMYDVGANGTLVKQMEIEYSRVKP